MIKYEFLIFLGFGLALGIHQLVSVRRDIRRAKEAEKPLDAAMAEEHKPLGRNSRGS